ncbi:MAG: DinB family protein [Anaerolineales bacterium]|nr:DinB family protein [Anaerolineales bacterium]
MNSIMQNDYPVFRLYQALRTQLMGLLSDDDLAFSPGGDNPTLGELCREMGEVQHAYVQSFWTFTMTFEYRNETPGLAGSVAQLAGWYQALDEALAAAVTALTEGDIAERRIARPEEGFAPLPGTQLAVYREALLIFYGKVSVYLKVLGKARPAQWQQWIA